MSLGKPEPGELGLPGVHVNLIDSAGKVVQNTTTAEDGSFAFDDVGNGSFKRRNRGVDVRRAVQRHLVARVEADHAVA